DTPLETLLQVVSQEPPRPRHLRTGINRDLETVCLKCLDKEPLRRYESAAALAADLERWLRGEPILARPVGAAERAWRWCRRQPALASLLAAVALTLVAGTAVSTFFAVVAGEQRRRADGQAAESSRLAARLCVDKGLRAEQDGDVFGALLWFAEPLGRPSLTPEQETLSRERL